MDNETSKELLKAEIRLIKAQRDRAKSEVDLIEEECRRLALLSGVKYKSIEELVADRSRKNAAEVIRIVAQKWKP